MPSGEHDVGGEWRTYRPPVHQRAILVGVAMFGVVPAVAVIAHGDAPAWGIALLISLAAVAAVSAALALRARIEVSPAGVVVQNGLRGHTFGWDEVDRFEIVDVGFAKGRVQLRDGRSVGSAVISPSRIARAADARTSAHETVDELNRLARRWGSDAGRAEGDAVRSSDAGNTTAAAGPTWAESVRQVPFAAVPAVGIYAASAALNEPLRRLAALRALFIGQIPLPVLAVAAAAFVAGDPGEASAGGIAAALGVAVTMGVIGRRAVTRLVPLPWNGSRSELATVYVKRCLVAIGLANGALALGFIAAVRLGSSAYAYAAVLPFAFTLLEHAPSEGRIGSLERDHAGQGTARPLSDALTATSGE